ncbi:MAG: thymidine kinase [Bacteroidetes bacterium]|nr:thymidine kinase [Bacteroidota bacterium]MBU1114610.1 thymidine kinase [Bacteroidota bacterium]MBU1797820.1 thymidine kinase [Bacteroidota bacterium]
MVEFVPHPVPHNTGWIEVISGCMFSGKTEELIRRLRRAKFAKLKVIIFKPKIDDRYSKDEIVSHSEQALPSTMIEKAEEILALIKDADIIGIDEAQFFDDKISNVVLKLAKMGKRVIVAGLDMDYKGEPFGPMPTLLAIAEYVTKPKAICVVCGSPATMTQRITDSKAQVDVGATDKYEARCRKHHYIP